jgi:hypothetical protein
MDQMHDEIPNPSTRSPARFRGPRPSAFYQVEKLKGGIAGQEFGSTEELPFAIRGLVTLLGPWPQISLWRLGTEIEQIHQMKGEYIP